MSLLFASRFIAELLKTCILPLVVASYQRTYEAYARGHRNRLFSGAGLCARPKWLLDDESKLIPRS